MLYSYIVPGAILPPTPPVTVSVTSKEPSKEKMCNLLSTPIKLNCEASLFTLIYSLSVKPVKPLPKIEGCR
jgi:hypothetical protein